ncbi:hypothetical protein KTT_28650 [Tengunoibacter tsumagoiensis]|uniref:Acyltransferase 3 domain-containing protein n=2 Tax=Tengunoibacter tsumagoiensis TaxID=2014871 RepID=A0A402A1S2_9CHLR|nr:hypothetical protein KTT_28650 [Tengunoibacter tsumagoiensis]
MFALLHGPKWFKHPLELAPLRWLGAISYSLYIWHMPLALLFFGYFFPYIHNRSYAVQYIISFLWIVIVILPFSVLSYRLAEKPGIRFGEYILRRMEKQKKLPDVIQNEDTKIGHIDATTTQDEDITMIAIRAVQ